MTKVNQSIATLFTLSFFLFSHTLCYSQSFNLKGNILDSAGIPIEYANVVILNMPDSSYCGGTVTDSLGHFVFSAQKGEYLAQFKMIGYNTAQHHLLLERNVDIGQIMLEENTYSLGEVTVTASRPQFKLINGNLITNVDNTLLSTIGTANDVIGQIPGISVNDDKEAIVFGKGAPIIYINNRRIYDQQELNQLQSSDISTIELLKNPGAKYDAESNAVIIIKTKSKTVGFSANVSGKAIFGQYVETNDNVSVAYSNKKLNTYLSYDYGHSKSKTAEESVYHIYADKTWSQTIDQPYVYQSDAHNFSTSFDYSFTDKQVVGVQYKGNVASIRNNLKGDENFFCNDVLLENITNNTLLRQSPNTHRINLFYNGNLSEKFEVRYDMDYVRKESLSTQFTDELSTIESTHRSLNIDSESNFNLLAGKLVGTYNIAEKSRIEMGAEYNIIRGDGSYKNSQYIDKNNIYTNDEEKFAAFLGYSSSINDFDYGLGVRYEYSHEKSTEDLTKTVRTDKSYSNFYPHLSLSKKFGDVALSLNANKKIRRPSFSELSSNDLYLNQFLTQKGNPYLKKEDYYEVGSNIQYKIFNISLGYSYVKNPISIEFSKDGDSDAGSVLSYKNYDKYQNINAMASINYTINFWKPQLTVGVMQPFFSGIYRDEDRKYNKANFVINFTNDFVLPKDYTISLYFTYMNDYDYYMIRDESYKHLDVRIRKSLLDKKLNLNLYCNDIFNLKKEKNQIYIGNYNLLMNKKRETQYVSFTVQYLFNSTQKRYRGQNASDELNRL